MKKYRSLWGMSTTNHNILYFVRIPGIRLLNPALCLWKARNSLAGRGFQPPALPSIGCFAGLRRSFVPSIKPSPRKTP
jgi:hypothetical protein